MKWRNAAVLLLLAGLGTGCAFLETMVGVAADPDVQERAAGVVANVIAGNYIGAAAGLGELFAFAAVAYKAVNMRRDKLREKRGEPTGAEKPAA